MKVVDQRLRKLLELRTDSPAMLEALNAVASVHRESGVDSVDTEGARRNLRSDIEHRGLDVIQDFIARLAPFEEKLVAFGHNVDTLADACDRASRRIEQSEADTATFLAQAEALARQRDAVDKQLSEVTDFLARFELTDDEAAALAMGPVEEDGGEAFFGALGRVNAIRLQSLSLLTGRDQALGIELLDAATRQQASALDRLFTWTDALCKDAEQVAAHMGDGSSSSGNLGEDDLSFSAASAANRRQAAQSPYRMLQRALNVLREQRLPYFRSCQETVVTARRTAFVRRFLRALSAGAMTSSSSGSSASGVDAEGLGPHGNSSSGSSNAGSGRPIDLHAHDPLRYVGDMLAWTHLNIVEERDLLNGLFAGPLAAHAAAAAAEAEKAQQQQASSPSAAATSDGSRSSSPTHIVTQPLPIRDMLASIVDGVSRPLCVRLEQVLASQTSLVTTLKLTDIIAYYCATLWTLLTSDTGLLAALAGGVHATAVSRFQALVLAQSARIRAAPPAFPSDLSACALVTDTAQQLEEIMRVYQASLASAAESKMKADASTASSSNPPVVSSLIDIGSVLDGILEPLVDTCRAGAEGLRISDTAVYMLNNLSQLQAALAPYPFTASWVQRLASEIAEWEEALVQQSANDLLAGCGLLAKLTSMRSHDPATSGGLPLASMPTLGPDNLRQVASAFYAELTAPTLISLFDRVGNPRVRSRVRRDTAAVLAAAYARFYADVTAPASGYSALCDVTALLPQSPEQVEVLLDLR